LLILALSLCAHAAREMLPRGTWYLRVTNPKGTAGALCVRVYFNTVDQNPVGDTLYVARGSEQADILPKDRWLQPGEAGDWVDISPHMPRRITTNADLRPVLIGAMTDPESNTLNLRVELARGTGKSPVRAFTVSDKHPSMMGFLTWLNGKPDLPTLGLLMPDASPGKRIYTFEEAAEQQLRWIKAGGPTPRPSRYIWFVSYQNIAGGDHQMPAFLAPSRYERLQTEIITALGYNNLTHYAQNTKDIAAIRKLGIEPVRAKMVHFSVHHDARTPDEFLRLLETRAKELKDAGVWDYVRAVSLGDEADVVVTHRPVEEQDRLFVAYLRDKGCDPLDFILPAQEAEARQLPENDRWRLVHLNGRHPVEKPKLLYEAADYRYRLWTEENARYTRKVADVFPPGTLTGINYTPGYNAWPDVRKFIDMIRDGGLTMPWSEDWWWGGQDGTPQAYGLLLAAQRHAADYHGSDPCFYVIPEQRLKDPRLSADHFLRMNYFALGHGAKVIDHFAIYHQGVAGYDHVDFDQSRYTYPAIRRITGAVGKIDERLYRARMRPAEVAICLSKANDIWDTENLESDPAYPSDVNGPHAYNLYYADLNSDATERKALWLALRHAQVPVDVITDEDIAAGMLAKYKVLYLVGHELLSTAVTPLAQWVEHGGTLVGDGGCGLVDEYREPIPAMSRLYGLAGDRLERPVRTVYLDRLLETAPLDTITFTGPEGVSLPVLCYKHAFQPVEDARVIATYADGTPACLERKVGKGRAIACGGLLGLAYARPAMTNRKEYPAVLAEGFPPAIRSLIAGWAESAGVTRPVVTSDPLVEATLQDGPKGPVVTLINFRNHPVKDLTVTFPFLPNARRIVSLQHGACKMIQTANGPAVRLSVDQGDFLIVD